MRLLRVLCALLIITSLSLIMVIHYQQWSSLAVNTNPQYFKDIAFHSAAEHFGANNHFDVRFAPPFEPSTIETQQTLKDLLSSFSDFMRTSSYEFWVAHGTLLGWCWNQKLLPWDTDIDVQVTADTLHVMAHDHNMSFHLHKSGSWRTHLLDVNPYFINTSSPDLANTIDARWIDTSNGKFIDITAVHWNVNDDFGGQELYCRDGHKYTASYNLGV